MAVDMIVMNGEIYTPQTHFAGNIIVDDGTIVGVTDRSHLPNATETIDAEGNVVLPGLITTHVHFRDPGQTYKRRFRIRIESSGGRWLYHVHGHA